jgi:hypothetical protein
MLLGLSVCTVLHALSCQLQLQYPCIGSGVLCLVVGSWLPLFAARPGITVLLLLLL